MKKNIGSSLLLFWLLLTFQSLSAGNPVIKLQFSQDFELPKKHFEDAFIGDAERGYLQISHCERKSLSFQKFDTNLKLISENTANIQDLPKDYYRLGYHDVGKNTYWFYTCWNKEERKQELFVRKIDFAKAGFDGASKKIIKADKLEVTYDILPSSDKKLVLVHYGLIARERGSNHGQLHRFELFDENMNKIWSTEQDFPLYTTNFSCVDRAGNIFCMINVANSNGDTGYHYEILAWSKGNQQPVKIPINLDGRFVEKPILTEDMDGNIVMAGYYATVSRDKGADGLFICKVNLEAGTTEKVGKGFYSFPNEIRYSSELEKTSKKGRPDAILKNLVFNEDGTIQAYGEVTADGEDWLSYFIKGPMKPSGQEISTYLNLDILALNIDKDGNLIWQARIPKIQKINGYGFEDGSDYGNGFSSFSYGQDKFFLFSDNVENENLQPGQTPKVHKNGAKGVLMAVRIEPSGKISRKLVYNANDNTTFLDALSLRKVSPNQMICTTSTDMVMKLALLTFE